MASCTRNFTMFSINFTGINVRQFCLHETHKFSFSKRILQGGGWLLMEISIAPQVDISPENCWPMWFIASFNFKMNVWPSHQNYCGQMDIPSSRKATLHILSLLVNTQWIPSTSGVNSGLDLRQLLTAKLNENFQLDRIITGQHCWIQFFWREPKPLTFHWWEWARKFCSPLPIFLPDWTFGLV